MTIKLVDNAVNSYVSFNVANVNPDNSFVFTLTSQWDKSKITRNAIIVDTNDRYTEFFIDINSSDQALEHINGIYNYTLLDSTNNETIDTGVAKLISGTGGTTGTTRYISSNEDRNADTYYRPNY
jgi:hypothetical protein